jgi:hypothetical protein
MKKFTYIFSIILLLFVASGCSKFVEGWDESPNDPTEVTPALLLTASQTAVFAAYEGQLARTSTIWVQQLTGTDFQMVNVNNYFVLEGDNVNEWTSIYTDGVVNLNEIINTYGAANPRYAGIAKVLKAMLMGITTDIWGDVPYSQAAQGLNDENFNPVFDNQESILIGIQTLLDEAIVNLAVADVDNVELPGTDDLIFGGDAAAWTKVAYALKARYYNRLSSVDASTSAQNALSAIAASGMTSSADDANAIHGENANEQNQWFAFQINRANYIKMSESFIDLLITTNDPRLPFYATPDTGGVIYRGTAITSDDVTTSDIGAYIASPTAPSKLMSFVELKFIEAECQLRSGNAQAAADAHNAAVIASVETVTGSAAPQEYIDNYASETSGSISLEKIIGQKYIANFTQVENWTDWRRTGFPVLSPNPNGTINGIPLRLPTVLDERLYNTNATVVSDKLTPVWWDQD